MSATTSQTQPEETTKSKLQAEIKNAMLKGEKERLGFLRLMFSEIKNAEINHATMPGKERPEAEVQQTLVAYHKSLAKSAAEYPAEKRAPLEAELKIVEEFLPKRLNASEIAEAVEKEIAGTAERNFGALMKVLSGKYGALCEGKVLSETLKQKLEALK